jgi:hypothetical protein
VLEASNAERRLLRGLMLDCNLELTPEVHAELADVRKEEVSSPLVWAYTIYAAFCLL